jgi:hypothetical protein
MARHNQAHRRFAPHIPNPSTVTGLKPDHPAVVEGRPLFPTTPVEESPRLLVSGHNNRKIGKEVLKGRWKGMPIYTLTLAERSTCPSSCDFWQRCYGNSMHLARRHEHGPILEDVLVVEVMQHANRHPDGFVVRLHVLGDFYSVEYVDLWRRMLGRFPALRVWGYTAYHPDADDDDERAIGEALALTRFQYPDRFAMRFSGEETRVVEDRAFSARGVLVCPAELSEKASCGSCAWCWERDEEIAFLLHGMSTVRTRRRGRPRKEAA